MARIDQHNGERMSQHKKPRATLYRDQILRVQGGEVRDAG